MKTINFLLICLCLNLISYGQHNKILIQKNNDLKAKTLEEIPKTPLSYETLQKAPGDIIWEEDFENGLPAGWTISDDAGIGSFVVTDTAYSGAWTNAEDAELDGIAGDDYYLHLPADFYNCIPGVWPLQMVASPIDMDATVETNWIDISGINSGIVLELSSWFRLCCSEADTKLDINVSTDGNTWTTFEGRHIKNYGISPISGYPPGENQTAINSYNITSVVQGASQVKIQFRMHGGSHYFWSIDDIKLIEALENEISIIDYYASSNGVYTVSSGAVDDYNTNYSEVPANIISNSYFGALIHQSGTNGENVYIKAKVDSITHTVFDSNSDTINNFGTIIQEDTVLIANNEWQSYNPSLTASDFSNINAFHDGIPYTFSWEIFSSNTDFDLSNNFQDYEYAQTWGRYSYHWQPSGSNATWHSDIGPFSYATPPGAVSDIFANTFSFEQEAGEEFKIYGLRIFIPDNSRVTFDAAGNGVTFIPILHYYDETENAGDGGWVEIDAVTGFPYTLLEGEEGDYIYLTFDEDEVNNHTFVHGEYSAGIRIEDYNGQKIAVGVDQTYRQGDSHFLMKIDPWQDTWYYWGTGGSAMIDVYTRLDQIFSDSFDNIKLISDNTSKINIYPNPSTNHIQISNISNAKLKIYSISGELVKSISNYQPERYIDLSRLSSGTYLIKIIEKDKITTKKLYLAK